MISRVVSIDIGYHNLGLVQATIDESYNIKIDDFFAVDLPKLPHRRVKRTECKIPHTNELADLMAHFIQEFGYILDNADRILIERQPPMGLTNVETLLLYLYRDKTELISPNSMHKHFMIGCFDYEKRKLRTIELSYNLLEHFEKYNILERKHDIADAVCMIIFINSPDKEKHRLSNIEKGLPFNQFIYHGSNSLQKT